MRHSLIHGDCLDGLGDLPSGSVDLVVTSPPYGDLRRYGGHTFDEEVFEAVAEELWRVSRPGGVVCWQTGDWMEGGSWTGTPYRQRQFFVDLGFRHYETLYTAARICQARHYACPPVPVFVLSKGRPTTVNLLTRPNKHAGEFCHFTRRHTRGHIKPVPWAEIREEGVREVWWTDYHPRDHCEEPYRSLPHGGTMHNLLARDLIRSYSNQFDMVIDPFSGLCTTGKWAALEGREFLGWEIHEGYWRWGCRRLQDAVTERIRML